MSNHPYQSRTHAERVELADLIAAWTAEVHAAVVHNRRRPIRERELERRMRIREGW